MKMETLTVEEGLSVMSQSNNSKARALTEQALELIAARFKVLAEPTRLRLLILLQNGDMNVSQLMSAAGTTQSNTSRHLHALASAGILKRRKLGLSVFYSIADPTIFELCEHVSKSLEQRLSNQVRAFS